MSEIKNKIEEYRYLRQMSFDLLEAIPEEELNFRVSEKVGSIGKQYRHLGDVELCYAKAIESGEMSFDEYRRDYSIESSKEQLKSFLDEMDEKLIEDAKQNPEAEINWFGEESLSVAEHLARLIQHEILHHGELVIYIRDLKLPFPQSWRETWGL